MQLNYLHANFNMQVSSSIVYKYNNNNKLDFLEFFLNFIGISYILFEIKKY